MCCSASARLDFTVESLDSFLQLPLLAPSLILSKAITDIYVCRYKACGSLEDLAFPELTIRLHEENDLFVANVLFF